MSSTIAEKVVEVLRKLFAEHGLQRTIVSDNGPPLHTEVFEEFLRGNGIQHRFCAPFHPATTGAAERAVQVLKQGLRKQTEGSLQTKLSRVLMAYRCTPHTSTGFTPSEMLFKRRLRTRLDLLHPEKLSEVQVQKEPKRKFQEGDGVLVRDYRNAKRSWIPGTILKCLGRAHYKVKVPRCRTEFGNDTSTNFFADQTKLQAPGNPSQILCSFPNRWKVNQRNMGCQI